MDMSFMSKFLVQGRDAGPLLEPDLGQQRRRRRRARSRTRSGSTRRGKLEADLTVTKLDDDRFWVVASDTAHRHVETWMRRHIRRRARVRHRRDVGLRADQRAGPALARAAAVADDAPTCRTRRSRSAPRARSTSASRACCASASPTSASSATSCTSRPSRPLHVYDRLVEAGATRRPAARRAEGARQPADGEGLPRLRPRHRQHRLGARGRPRLRGRPRRSRAASSARTRCSRRRPAGPLTRRLVQILRQGPGAADVPRRGRAPRRQAPSATSAPRRTATRSAARSASRWSRPASRSPPSYLDAGTWTVEIAGREYPARASSAPLYDPTNERIRS